MNIRSKSIAAGFAIACVGGIVLWAALHFRDGHRLNGKRGQSPAGYAGSAACRPCHEEFYIRWKTSRHGRAMQPYSAEFAKQLKPQNREIVIGDRRYRAVVGDADGWIMERGSGEENRYRIAYALGGKNVYYFLTALEKGRLQTLPVAYDAARGEWFDTAASALRHFRDLREEPVFWKEHPYTFNSACFGCHVSQMSTNYDPLTDSYATTWAESGINCETCHGPGEKHVRAAEASLTGISMQDPMILRMKSNLTVRQRNDACAPCHAKMTAITSRFQPGDRFFDHFDLVTLESADFYPDGRDLGENYTETQWMMNRCAQSGQLDCIHCHTSSGRYRFREEEKANEACMPCHETKVRNVSAHSRHGEKSQASRCISCHMPVTEFARMRRSDHSFRPPAPSATIAFDSPNACTLCHEERDAAWADRWVRRWHQRDFQAGVLHRGQLIAAARRQAWTRLEEMLDCITSGDREEVAANSLLRLLRSCKDPRRLPAFLKALADPSPLLRASAAEALGDALRQQDIPALVAASRDPYRLVRVRAGASLAKVPAESMPVAFRLPAGQAVGEHLASLTARPDDYASLYNLANYHMERGEPARAIECFEKALRIEPKFLPALVNVALAYNATGQNNQALQFLLRASEINPRSVPAQLNLGLLLGEMGRPEDAKKEFRRVLEIDPASAAAAYNLGILMAAEDIEEAVRLCRRAFGLQPSGKHGFTLAFYLRQKGDIDGGIRVLGETIQRDPGYPDAYRLLAALYDLQGRAYEAAAVSRELRKLEKK